MNLLIVDDIATNRKLLRVTLEAEGYHTLEAADGVEALQILARETVDAVISDILMPNMDGFRLCHEIRKSERLHALPFIIYTSTYTSPGDLKLAQTIGADKYLTKPAPIADVLDALREVLEKKAARPMPAAPVVEETYVLQQYSQALVHKLEEKNAELKDALDKLQRAHERIVGINKQLEAFVYSIAHDLRAPLRSMQGFSAMLVKEAGTALNEAGRDYADRISTSAQFMDAMLRDLLVFSRISQQRVELTSVNLKTVVESVLSSLQKDIQEKNARVESSGPWPAVLAHEPTLAQVLFNLVSNALKFVTPDVPPLVRLRAEAQAEFIRVWVEDNGPGIAPDHQGQIFQLFTRLNNEKYQGTGIGLTIVQKGVERMSGRVGVESIRPGEPFLV